MPSIRICSTRSDPIREMHLQSFGNPSQYADEKHDFVAVNLFGVPILGDSSRIVGNPYLIALRQSCSSSGSNLITVDFAGRSNAWLFLGLGPAAEVVKETEDERDFVCRRGLAGASALQHAESLAVGVEVKVHASQTFCELPGRPELRFAGAERFARNGIRRNHNLAVRRAEKKFLAGARPLWVAPTAG